MKQRGAEKFKALVKTSPDAVTVTDISGKITEVSHKLLNSTVFRMKKNLLEKNSLT